MTDNTIFDSVFKTMLQKTPQLAVPLINEAFGRSYALDSAVELFSNEHESLQGTVIADSVFRLGGKIYHVECQSTPDSAMVVRMIEYDFAIALEDALASGAPYRMEFPSSCVLFLRHTRATPDVLEIEVALPDGSSFTYGSKVVKAQSYSKDDIFDRDLLLLLPFYLMRYEKRLEKMAPQGEEADRLIAECAELRGRLEAATLAVGEMFLYEELTELIIRISDYLMRANELLRKKVRVAMGGEVLELMGERAKRLEAEAEQRGIEQGIEQGTADMAAMLRERGVDPALLEEVQGLVRSSGKRQE